MCVPYVTSANSVCSLSAKLGIKALLHHFLGGKILFGHQEHAPFGFQSYRRRLGPTLNIHLITIICQS